MSYNPKNSNISENNFFNTGNTQNDHKVIKTYIFGSEWARNQKDSVIQANGNASPAHTPSSETSTQISPRIKNDAR
jgi:hypothetical protein